MALNYSDRKKSHVRLEGPVTMFTETATDTHHHIKYSVNLMYTNTPKKEKPFSGQGFLFRLLLTEVKSSGYSAAIFPD